MLSPAASGRRRRAACYSVAVALAVASALASGAPVAPVRVRRLGIVGVVDGARRAQRSGLPRSYVCRHRARFLAPVPHGSTGAFYSPMCGLLALATATAVPAG